jgi:cytochrome P450
VGGEIQTYIGFNAYTIHRSRQWWGDDADQFVPERWLDRERVRAMHPFQYFPFLAGPRVCLGMHMALLVRHATPPTRPPHHR